MSLRFGSVQTEAWLPGKWLDINTGLKLENESFVSLCFCSWPLFYQTAFIFTYEFPSISFPPTPILLMKGVTEKLGGHLASTWGQPTTAFHSSTFQTQMSI